MSEFTIGYQTSGSENDAWSRQECSTGEWIEKGEAAFSGADMEKAKECFERALHRDPLNVKALNNLSVVHWKQGNSEESLGYLTRALEWDPNDKDVIINCCNVFKAMGKIGDAEEILESYLSRNPWEEEVRELLNLRDGAAVQAPPPQPSSNACVPGTPARTEAPKTVGDPADFFTQQGEEKFGQGKFDHARVCFEMALDHNPDHPIAHCNLGVVLWRDGRGTEALEHLYRAIQLEPENPEVLLNSAKVLAAVGEVATAKDFFKLYLQRNPKDDAVWKEYEQLVQSLDLHAWKPKDLPAEVADIYDKMGKALAEAGDVLGAAEAFKKAIQIDHERTEPYFQLARLHQGIGQESEAASMLQEMLRFNPANAEGVLEAGRILASLGRNEEATLLYEAYLSDYNHEEIRSALESTARGV